MKKIFNTIFAAAAIFAGVACSQVEKTVFSSADATLPVLVTVTPEAKALVVDYTPGEVPAGYVVYHTVAIVKADDQQVSRSLKTSEVKDAGGEVIPNRFSVSLSEIQNGLLAVGCAYSATVNYELAVRMSLQTSKADNSRNGYFDSENTYSASIKLPDPPKEGGGDGSDPYAGWETSSWGVIGSIASTGNAWNADIEMVTDGTWHVAKGVVLTPSDQFKFRKDADWGVNFGGEFVALETEFEVTQDGPNISVTEAGTYDLFLNPDAGIAKIIVTGSNVSQDPYAGWEDATDWGVIGSIASTGNAWNADEPMVTNGSWYACKGLELTTSDQFKFRKDADWGVNFGGEFATLGEKFDVSQDGPNISVQEDGTYDLLLNPGSAVALIIKSGDKPVLE